MSDKAFEWGSAEFAFQMPDNWPSAIEDIKKSESLRRHRERDWPVHQKTNYRKVVNIWNITVAMSYWANCKMATLFSRFQPLLKY